MMMALPPEAVRFFVFFAFLFAILILSIVFYVLSGAVYFDRITSPPARRIAPKLKAASLIT